MKISPPRLHVRRIADAMVREASLPNWNLGSKTMREATLDEANCPFKRDALRSHNQMYVIGHYNECVQFVVTQPPIVLKSFEE